MSLSRLIARKSLTVLGLNSGTSADSLDMAVVRFSASPRNPRIRFLGGAEKRLPAGLRQQILELADTRKIDLDELIYLDNLLGRFYGRAAAEYLRALEKSGVRVDLIASHGQTVRHLPQKVKRLGAAVRGTMQLGSPEFVATLTDRPVVSDFRQADVALGNEGAPITVAAMQRLFASGADPALLVNIGGIANYFYFPAPRARMIPLAEDCGPGNCLSDILSESLYGRRFDRHGVRARRGVCSMRLLSLLLANPFFAGKSVSTGREQFGRHLADEMISFARRFSLPDEDLIATAIELTVTGIVRKVEPIIARDRRLSKLYLTGGGRHNIFLVDRLAQHLPELEICMIDDLGINGDYIEAAAYAVMGEACLRSRSTETRFTRGRRQMICPVAGRITQPPQRARAGKGRAAG